jgi:23S rRNA pseudouridine1911/1915/1917 synthase
MLHAAELGFVHPSTENEVRWERPLPPDMAGVLERLRRRGG